ncbi:hypothetical protein LTR56_014861 [Elasticomyces elasticus]|nr:hypothetical protein LTR56_014861 [Elasticomyces elasticus]KAK3644681.1 hypothetical protein LTR22_015056 [Elasticomyces elasticus]KAK4916066.1 hypothetical protein LTR49_015840 [Elasticomyces elasticus]KAK5755194.1 hypothetical protein LTS12_014758 [Elasticomyces elasticus]
MSTRDQNPEDTNEQQMPVEVTLDEKPPPVPSTIRAPNGRRTDLNEYGASDTRRL